MDCTFTKPVLIRPRQNKVRMTRAGLLPYTCIILLMLLTLSRASAQINMKSGTVTTCSDMFYDSGGPSGEYSSDEDKTLTIYPATAGIPLQVEFSSFETESDYDYLYIYDGNSTAAPLIGEYSGTSSPGTITSSAADGSLTFLFTSDGSASYAGWLAEVSCMIPCSGKPVGGTATASTTSGCPGVPIKLNLSGSTGATGLTYQWDSSATGAAGSFAAIAGAASKAISFTPPIGRTLYYRCRVTCTASGSTATSTTIPVSVASSYLYPPYSETFESLTVANTFPSCMSATRPGSYVYSYLAPTGGFNQINHTPGGSKYASFGYDADDYLFSPGLYLEAGKTYRFSFWYITDGSDGWTSLSAKIGNKATPAAMTVNLGTESSVTNTTYKRFLADFTVPASGIYFIGINCVATSAPYYLTIDDIDLVQLPPCSTGVLAAGNKASATPKLICSTPDSALLTLADPPAFAGLTYQWEQATGAPVSFTPISGATTTKYKKTGISAPTYFRCQISCPATGSFVYSDTVSVLTLPLIPPYHEDFESGTANKNMPCAFYTYDFGYSASWNVEASPVFSYLDNHTPGGSQYLVAGYILDYYSGEPEMWFSPAIAFTAGKRYQLSYWYITDGYDGCTYGLASFMGNEQTKAAMTTRLGAPFTTTTSKYQQYKVLFTAAATGNFYIGIQKSQTNWGYGLAIDDIGLQEGPACSAAVAAGTIVSAPLRVCRPGDVATLDLEGGTLATGLSYEWLSSNSATGTFTPTGASGLPYTTFPLTSNTWFKAVVTCAASGLSDTTPAFRINVGGIDIPYTEDFESMYAGDKPSCSDATSWGTDYYDGWYVCPNHAIGYPYNNNTPGGKNFLVGGFYLGSPESVSEDNYWFTPGLNLKASYTYNLSFYYVGGYDTSFSNKMGVYLGSSQSVAAMKTTVLPYRTVNNASYLRLDTALTVPSDGVYYLGFRKSGIDPATTYSYYGVAFDDINLNYAPCNGLPAAGKIVSEHPSGTPYCRGKQLKLTDIGATISLVPGIRHQWMRKSLSALPAAWAPVAGATDTVLDADTLTGYEYRLAVICANTEDTVYTPPFLVPQAPPHPPVTISPSTSPATFCLGDTVKFTATDYPGAVYDWMRDSVVVPGWKFSDMGATEPGTYVVKVTSARSPCPVWSNPVELVENAPAYKVSVTTPADSILCAGASILLTATASKPGVSFQWRKNNILIPGATGNTYLVSTGGFYRVIASDGVSHCAAASRNINIIVKPNPPAVISTPGGVFTGCEGEGVRLDANTGGFSYEWARGGSTVVGWTDSSMIIRNSGSYTVKVRNADGCANVSSPVTVTILPSPDPLITRSGNVLGTTVFPSYQWIRNGLDISGANSQHYTITKKGVYKVRVTDTNNCIGTSLPLEAMDDELSIATDVEDRIRIYPNPTVSKVYIESPVQVNAAVKDVSGKTVLNVQDAREIDLSNYADGVYLLILSDKEEILYRHRIIKTSK